MRVMLEQDWGTLGKKNRSRWREGGGWEVLIAAFVVSIDVKQNPGYWMYAMHECQSVSCKCAVVNFKSHFTLSDP